MSLDRTIYKIIFEICQKKRRDYLCDKKKMSIFASAKGVLLRDRTRK